LSKSKTRKITGPEVKTFKDLADEIIKQSKCCACGSCVAYCESQSFNVITMENHFPRFKSEETIDNCKECGICYYICPQTPPILELIEQSHEIQDKLGKILSIQALRTTKKELEDVRQDGGIVSTILEYLFDKSEIDAAIVSEYDEQLQTIPKIIFNKDELVKAAGTRYSISSQVLPLKDLYQLTPDFLWEKGIVEIDQLRIAFVGTPCQVRAIAKMKQLSIKPAHLIKLVISLFCFENFNHDELYEILTKETNVKPTEIKKTWIKKNFFIKDNKGNKHEVDIKKLDPAVREHCLSCDDFTGKFSDISVGASGAPEGFSMVVVRNEKGQKVINGLIKDGYAKPYSVPLDQINEWKIKKINRLNKMISLKIKKNK